MAARSPIRSCATRKACRFLRDDPVDAEGLPASVRAFFEREVKPHVPDAWIDTKKRDAKDGRVGLVGYEINFNRYFYRYAAAAARGDRGRHPRYRDRLVRMLAEVTGSNSA